MERRMLLALIPFCLLPERAVAARQQVSTGIAVPSADGITINGSRLGDDDYDLSRPQGGRYFLTGREQGLSCRALYQKSDLDPAVSSLSAVTLLVEHASLLFAEVDHALTARFAAGVSYASMSSDFSGRDADDHLWIFQAGAALCLRIAPAVTIDLRYRRLWPEGRSMRLNDNPVEVNIGAHHLLVGVRFGF